MISLVGRCALHYYNYILLYLLAVWGHERESTARGLRCWGAWVFHCIRHTDPCRLKLFFLWLSRLSSQHPLNSLSLAWGCLNSFNHVKHLKTLCTLKEREEVSKGLLGRLGAKSWLSEWFVELAKASANFNRQLIGAVLKQCPQLADQMVAQLKPCMFFLDSLT